MKKIKKVFFIFIIFIGILCIASKVEATSITSSANTIERGKSVTITVSVPNVNTVDLTATISGAGTSGTIRLVDGSMTGEPKTFSKSITVTPTSTGTISVVVSSESNAVLNGQYIDVSASKNITVTEPAPVEPTTPPSNNTGSGSNGGGNNSNSNNNSGSSNNNTRPTETTPRESSNSRLASLEITEGVISPEFNSDVTEYAISVPNDITVLNISAVAEDSAAEVEIVGNEELKIGENNIQIIVTAEDGSTTTYNILATRADEQLSLQSLSIYYIDENGQKVELKLNPTFALDVYEYNILEKLSNTVNKLEVEAIATKENAKIEITGNNELKAGQNEISIKVTLTDEAGLEEQKTYTILVEKEEEPQGALTFWEKMSRWFNGAGITISTWFSENLQKIIIGMLIVATVTFIGLTVYFVYDYKNYKKLLSKLAEYNKENLMERANTALNPEMAENNEDDNIENNLENNTDINKEDNANNNIVEQIYNAENPETGENVQEITEKPKAKLGKGKRFK